MKTIHEYLKAAKALFKRGEFWCAGAMCETKECYDEDLGEWKNLGNQYCAVGAIRKAVSGKPNDDTSKTAQKVIDFLVEANPEKVKVDGDPEEAVITFNDGQDYNEVSKIFTKAIRKARDLGV